MKKVIEILIFLLKANKKYIYILLSLIALSILSAVIEVFVISLFRIYIEFAAGKNSVELFNIGLPPSITLKGFTFAYSSLIILSALMRSLVTFSFSNMTISLGNKLTTLAYNSLLEADTASLIKSNKSNLISIISNYSQLSVEAISYIFKFFIGMSLCLACFMVILIGFPVIYTLLIFFIALVYTILVLNFRPRFRRLSMERNQSISSEVDLITNYLNNIRNIRLENLSHNELSRFSTTDFKLQFSIARSDFYNILPKTIVEAIALISLIVLTILSIDSSSNDALTVLSSLSVFAFALFKMILYAQISYASWSAIKARSSAIEIVGNAIKYTPKKEILSPQLERRRNLQLSAVQNFSKICIKNVSFRYSDEANYVLKDCNITIDNSGLYVLKGTSGCGKSTFLDLLMGFIPTTNGTISLNLENKKEFLFDSCNAIRIWQRMIAYVPQLPFLRNGSILEALIPENFHNYSFPGSSLPDYVTATCQKIGIHETIMKLPDGYFSTISNHGANFSGGQRQRIAIASALIRNKPIIILDEPTASLDSQSTELVASILNQESKEKLVLAVCHSDIFSDFEHFILHFKEMRIQKRKF